VEDILHTFALDSPLFPSLRRIKPCTEFTFVPEAFQMMITQGIDFLPVIEQRTGKYLTLVNLIDFVAFFLGFIPEDAKSLEDIWKVPEVTFQRATKIPDVNPSPMVLESISVGSAIQTMLNKNSHKLVLINQDQILLNIVTQLDLLRFVSLFLDGFQQFKKSLKELGWALKPVVTISEDEPTKHGFAMAIQHRITGIGVVNSMGQLTGNLSITDFRSVGDINFIHLLNEPVQKHIQRILLFDAQIKVPYDQYPLCCQTTSSLVSVINTMLECQAHRMYVVDETKKPIGIISISDILHHLLPTYSKNEVVTK